MVKQDVIEFWNMNALMGLEKNQRERWVYVVKRTCEVGGKPKGEKACN